MGRLGAHVSVSGGISHSVARARFLGCEAYQIFTRNQRQWDPKPLDNEDAEKFRREIEGREIFPVVSHGSYLINPASPEEGVRTKSLAALVDELSRCVDLSIDRLVIHPGSHKGSGQQEGLNGIVSLIDSAFLILESEGITRSPRLLLETTAGQGSGIGSKFEELAGIMEGSDFSDQLGVCLDTAHMHAAGYDMTSTERYEETIDLAISELGVYRILCIHLNDSRKELGSRVDRHDNIGEGSMGLIPFRCLVNDERFKDIPMILETPGGDENYKRNLELLKGMRDH